MHRQHGLQTSKMFLSFNEALASLGQSKKPLTRQDSHEQTQGVLFCCCLLLLGPDWVGCHWQDTPGPYRLLKQPEVVDPVLGAGQVVHLYLQPPRGKQELVGQRRCTEEGLLVRGSRTPSLPANNSGPNPRKLHRQIASSKGLETPSPGALEGQPGFLCSPVKGGKKPNVFPQACRRKSTS